MIQTITAVLDTNTWHCPHCESEVVNAVKNGFQVDNTSTDLARCSDCKTLFVVYPLSYIKRKPRLKRSFPKLVEVEVTDEIKALIDRIDRLQGLAATMKRPL